VVVNRALCAFSGNIAFRRAVTLEMESAFTSGGASSAGVCGNGSPRSDMIWSASFRRSEDRSGDSGLIWRDC
jgi:hypothetical protein